MAGLDDIFGADPVQTQPGQPQGMPGTPGSVMPGPQSGGVEFTVAPQAPPPPSAAVPTPAPMAAPPPPPPETPKDIPPPDLEKDLQGKPTPAPAPVPGEPKVPGGPPKPPSLTDMGADALPRIAWAVDGVESGHKHTDDQGRIKTSDKGAVGRMGLLPSSFPGKNVQDEQTNLALGKEELSRLYKIYGNWNDTLVAYNWGSGNADKWIEKGRPYGSLPEETRSYLAKVATGLGATPGYSFTAKKDSPGTASERLDEIIREQTQLKGGTPTEGGRPLVGDDDSPFTYVDTMGNPIQTDPKEHEAAGALTFGAYQALRDQFVTGPWAFLKGRFGQEGSEKEFADWVNQMDAPFAGMMERHPYMGMAGNIIGTGIGVMAGGKLLGIGRTAAEAAPLVGTGVKWALSKVPAWAKWGAGGTVAGGLTFNPDPDSASRVGEAVLGGVAGELGYSVGRMVSSAVKWAGDTAVYKEFVAKLRENMQNIDADATKIKDAFVSHYARKAQEKNTKYTVRNAAGDVIEGYPTGLEEGGGISKIIEDTKKGIFTEAGREVQATREAESLARRLDDTLGLKQQRQEMEEHMAKMEEWEKARAKTDDIKIGGRRLGDFGPGERPALETQLRANNILPEAPPHPGVYESRPIRAQQYADSRTEIEQTIRRTKSPKAKFQMRQLKQQLEKEASDTAGGDVTDFEKKMRRADKFNRETYAPMQEIAGRGVTPQELRDSRKFTNADMYNKVIGVVRGNDRAAQATLFKALGPEGRRRAAIAIQHDMFTSAISGVDKRVNPQAISKYIVDHEGGLRQMLGRDEFERLQGIAKISEHMLDGARRNPRGFVMHHKWLLFVAGTEALRGEFERAGIVAGSAIGASVIENAARAIRINPRLDVLLPKAATAKPGSPELERIVNRIGQVMGRVGVMGGTALSQSTGGLPAITGGVSVEDIQQINPF